MKKWGAWFVLALVVGFVLGAPLLVAGVGVVDRSIQVIDGQKVEIVRFSWTSDAAGEVYVNAGKIDGKLFAVKTVPGTGGDQPTDNYDIYIRDYATSYNYLSTSLENRDNVDAEFVMPAAPVPIYGPIGFSISGAGDTNKGDAYLYVEIVR